MRYSTILFDLDGTLIDSVDLIVKSYRHTMIVHRGAAPPDQLFIDGMGTPLRSQLAEFARDQAELDAMIATYREWNLSHHDEMVTAYPDALATVEALKARGARLGIVTSKNLRGLMRGLTLCGFDGLFKCLITCDSLPESKPDPAPVRMALKELGAAPHEAMFVGDSPHDVAAGRDAGVATAACLWGPFSRERLARERPTCWLHKFSDLLPVVLGEDRVVAG